MITDSFAPLFLQTINEMQANPVHLLFNQWWQHAPAEVVSRYREMLLSDPDFAAFVEEGFYAEPLDMDELAALPEGSFGRVYHGWIVDNGLTAQIAMNYRGFHQALAASGMLDGMPEELQYAILRGFQQHDFMHVLSGYDSSPQGEIALQAFCLGQLQFPYFAMWMSTVTTQMTYIDPTRIVPLMDAISDGWNYGRATAQLQLHRWEDELARPLEELRAEWRVVPTPLVQTLWDRRRKTAAAA
jgi:ubiquinone biosynthesis protein COQ4